MRTDCCNDYPECFHGKFTVESVAAERTVTKALHPEINRMDQKLAAAREWLGDRYLCAHPIERRKQR